MRATTRLSQWRLLLCWENPPDRCLKYPSSLSIMILEYLGLFNIHKTPFFLLEVRNSVGQSTLKLFLFFCFELGFLRFLLHLFNKTCMLEAKIPHRANPSGNINIFSQCISSLSTFGSLSARLHGRYMYLSSTYNTTQPRFFLFS